MRLLPAGLTFLSASRVLTGLVAQPRHPGLAGAHGEGPQGRLCARRGRQAGCLARLKGAAPSIFLMSSPAQCGSLCACTKSIPCRPTLVSPVCLVANHRTQSRWIREQVDSAFENFKQERLYLTFERNLPVPRPLSCLQSTDSLGPSPVGASVQEDAACPALLMGAATHQIETKKLLDETSDANQTYLRGKDTKARKLEQIMARGNKRKSKRERIKRSGMGAVHRMESPALAPTKSSHSQAFLAALPWRITESVCESLAAMRARP